jgi:hypothetical protein
MIEGRCPKCGEHYFGWALRFARNRYCNVCGTALAITEDNESIAGYSPFDAEEYSVNKSEIHDSSQQVRGSEKN